MAPASCLGITNGTTENDLINGVCKNLTLIFARGTTENGNIGDIVGPPFVNALVSMLGKAQVAVQGVNNYPADVQDFLAGGSVTGSQDMAALIAQAMTRCPGTKLCVSGYSQGAQVAHNAVNLISQAQTNFINSVVLFGDPDDGEAFGKVPANNVSVDCHTGGTHISDLFFPLMYQIYSRKTSSGSKAWLLLLGPIIAQVPCLSNADPSMCLDDICLHGDLILVPHLDYCLDADAEASFVVQKSGLETVGAAGF